MSRGQEPSPAVVDALRLLGVRNLVLGIHDASFPASAEDDTGRGSPYSPASAELLVHLRQLGFNGLQLGPQGLTERGDPSPYTGTLFSRDPLSISLARLAERDGEWLGLLEAEELAALVERRPDDGEERVPYVHVHRAHREALASAWRRFEARERAGHDAVGEVALRLQQFSREAAPWLEPDAFYEVLRTEYGEREHDTWSGEHADLDRALGAHLAAEAEPGPRPANGEAIAARRQQLSRDHSGALRCYRFVQLVAHVQHRRFRDEARELGLRLYGDFQVGTSPRDAWRSPSAFLREYRLGAPPSRTNSEGQPWHYPVFDPDRYGEHGAPGPVLRFLRMRIEKAFAEYDAVRIDHPQGLVCPWVYRADEPDAVRAVQRGARLFSSPDLADHPELARYAIPSRAQLNADPRIPRYDDHWVVSLQPDQIDRYAVLMDLVAETARRQASGWPALVCEVLSTLPHPLACVLARHDLGRFRVTQKAKLADSADVYRADNAQRHDWVLFGNHDTPPLWQLLPRWQAEGRLGERARHAARALAGGVREQETLAATLAQHPEQLAHAEIAQLFASPAENVLIYVSDLLGVDSAINRPGTIGGDNWRLRLPRDWRSRYAERRSRGRALDLRLALAMALRTRPGGEALATALERQAGDRAERHPQRERTSPLG